MAKLLLTSDWHLRMDVPICRDDDFLDTQEKTLKQIAGICREKECSSILVAGDVFDKAKPDRAQELEIMLSEIFDGICVYFVCGQHDLLFHKFENKKKGSIGVIERYNCFHLLENVQGRNDFNLVGFSYGQEISNIFGGKIVCMHRYCELNSVPEYMLDGITAKFLCEEYDYDVFVVGDNHAGFVYENNTKVVVNPGCITRQTADKKNYKPRVYIFDTITRKYETIFLLDDDISAVNDSYLEEARNRESRVDSFVKKFPRKVNLYLHFADNVIRYMNKNRINKKVQNIVLEIIGG